MPTERCDGSGLLKTPRDMPGNVYATNCPGCPACRPCRECGGSGVLEIETKGRYTEAFCPHCNGTGVEPK